ncbi:glycosyltransferase [Telluribacter sp.]|jgi:cellulose synthase/poly-beta-1,6-N-acetylglucosamine synthase-like glycosyltransferase|uniref:glycosyltransferase family 2 protein n=1 Tax=Telluribacter sp. TaxID=1978767 RepID=UPI002E0D74A9|nr:glycosyltransferase [Telluribacter sp.]
MEIIVYLLSEIYTKGLLLYCITVLLITLTLGIVSFRALRKYLNENRRIDYADVVLSNLTPSISLVAPAYNEGKTIVENIRSLLSIHYANYEVIIVNDGSKDDSLQRAIEAYQLEVVDFAVNEELVSKPIWNVYKSSQPAYRNLIVVDKENGGKADALNAGINVSSGRYVACIDVDCVLVQDSLLKMVKPFLESKTKVIATGGVIRIANSCEIEHGNIVKVKVPDSFLARVQVLEYLRSFLMARMAWGKIDYLLLISGAFGMFDREIVIKVGGYNTKTVGEDLELVVRMRRYMIDNKLPHSVKFIPDPLCWTEVPETRTILNRQRNRWMRGTIETLLIHRKMFFNPTYGKLGLLSYPYWFFYEFMAPLIEFFGFLIMLALTVLGLVDWTYFLSLMGMVYAFVIMFNLFTLLAEEFTYFQYTRYRDLFKLIGTALLEPFLFHPFVVLSAIEGNLDLLEGKKSWGEMTRKGFTKKEEQPLTTTPQVAE